jgi:hypothetical protein
MLYPKDLVDIVLGAVHVSKIRFGGQQNAPAPQKS